MSTGSTPGARQRNQNKNQTYQSHYLLHAVIETAAAGQRKQVLTVADRRGPGRGKGAFIASGQQWRVRRGAVKEAQCTSQPVHQLTSPPIRPQAFSSTAINCSPASKRGASMSLMVQKRRLGLRNFGRCRREVVSSRRVIPE